MVHTINKRTDKVSNEHKHTKVETCDHIHEQSDSSKSITSETDKKESKSNNTSSSIGPVKVAVTHYYRSCGTSHSIDYNPQLCKDYNQTGSCGYGDTCKYAHVREKYEVSCDKDSKHIHKHKKVTVEKF